MSTRKLAQLRTIRRKRRATDEAPPERALRPAGHGARDLLGSGVLAHATAGESRQTVMRDLQQTSGNQRVQRLLAREQAAPADPAVSAAGAQVKDTDYGSFLVYPDNQPLSLGLAQDPKREWPVTQRIFDRLQKVIDLLKSGASEVRLEGGSAFKVALLMDLDWLLQQAAGPDLLKALTGAGKRLRIAYAPGGNDLRAVAETSAAARPDGTPGPGSDVEIDYKPAAWDPAGGNAAWERREPATALARLLVEALPLVGGTAPSPLEREPVTAGQQATGQDTLSRAIALENRLRGAFGMPLRPEE